MNFARLYALHQASAFFVTRAKSPMIARCVYSQPTDRSTGVICNQRVLLNGPHTAVKYPEYLRRIRFKDRESGKTLIVKKELQLDASLYTCLQILSVSVSEKTQLLCAPHRSARRDQAVELIQLLTGQ